MGIKKGCFGGKKQVFWLEKLWADNQNRKAKWCKMQVFFLKSDKLEGMKGQKKVFFTYFLSHIFARTERKLERFCKIKANNLSF